MGGLEKQGARATGDRATGLGCPTRFLHSLIHAEMWGLREGWGLTLVLMRSTLWWGSREEKGGSNQVWERLLLRWSGFYEGRPSQKPGRLSWGWRVWNVRLLGLP